MKNLLKLSALAAVLVASATYASADSLLISSYGTTSAVPAGANNAAVNLAGFYAQTPTVVGGIYTEPSYLTWAQISAYSGVANTYDLNPNGIWANGTGNSYWVGSATTAGPTPMGAGTVDPAQGFYIYNTTFNAAGGLYSGTLSVYADDTVAVYLNGNLLITYGTLGSDLHCADNVPTCLQLDTITYGGGSQLAVAGGKNTLTFVVAQAGDMTPGQDPSGVDFYATLNSVPEPSTLLMLGTGLMGSAGALFRRMRS